MPTQSLDLASAVVATFNGADVELINLNGASIWTKPASGFSTRNFYSTQIGTHTQQQNRELTWEIPTQNVVDSTQAYSEDLTQAYVFYDNWAGYGGGEFIAYNLETNVIKWQKHIGAIADDYYLRNLTSVVSNVDGHYIFYSMTSNRASPLKAYNMYVKLHKDTGAIIWSTTDTNSWHGSAYIRRLKQDDNGNLYTVTRIPTTGTTVEAGIVIRKLSGSTGLTLANHLIYTAGSATNDVQYWWIEGAYLYVYFTCNSLSGPISQEMRKINLSDLTTVYSAGDTDHRQSQNQGGVHSFGNNIVHIKDDGNLHFHTFDTLDKTTFATILPSRHMMLNGVTSSYYLDYNGFFTKTANDGRHILIILPSKEANQYIAPRKFSLYMVDGSNWSVLHSLDISVTEGGVMLEHQFTPGVEVIDKDNISIISSYMPYSDLNGELVNPIRSDITQVNLASTTATKTFASGLSLTIPSYRTLTFATHTASAASIPPAMTVGGGLVGTTSASITPVVSNSTSNPFSGKFTWTGGIHSVSFPTEET